MPSFSPNAAPLVARVWQGKVPAAKAEKYEKYLYDAGIKKIQSIPGNIGVQMMRRPDGKNVEFTVISYWETRDAIRRFAGNDIEKPHHLPRDQEFLTALPKHVYHHDVAFCDVRRLPEGTPPP